MADPINSFYFGWKNPFRIRQHPSHSDRWLARGRLEVVLTLNPSYPNIHEIEYRQYIKGTGKLTLGTWVDGFWYPIGQVVDMANNFPVPPDPATGASAGLKTTWKEDGLSLAGVDYRYGYRNRRMRDGSETIDQYYGPPSKENLYIAYDLPRIDGKLADGIKIEIHLDFVGAVINTRTRATFQYKQIHGDIACFVRGSSLLPYI
jgi:hypothetical protein